MVAATLAPLDIYHLRQFYSSPLGRMVKATLRRLAREHVGNVQGEVVVGLGYTTPLLRILERDAPTALLAMMPAAQGAMYWPIHTYNRATLTSLPHLPLHDNSVHRLVVMHALELEPDPVDALHEWFRVLVPGGKMLLMVPRARSLWRLWGDTPFRACQSFSKRQVQTMLRESEFTLCHMKTALLAPPSNHPLVLMLWRTLDWLSRWVIPGFGGVWMVDAEKQIYAAIAQPVAKAKRRQKTVAVTAPSASRQKG
jgi:SAM-dependent methyltransferase